MLTRLVLFDTWTLNCDRHPPSTSRKPNHGNLFLSAEGATAGQFVAKAIDHGHCFTCGADLTPAVNKIERAKDERLYGMFPQFAEYLSRDEMTIAVSRLREITRAEISEAVHLIPPEWQVSSPICIGLTDLIDFRRVFVADRIVDLVWPPKDATARDVREAAS